MIDKRALLQGTPSVEFLAPQQRVKTAGALPVVQAFLDSLKPDSRYTYALVNAMGYSEFFGPNSNADWYGLNPHLGMNGLLHAWPEIGADIVADQMKGKDWSHGYPCFYNAAVYAHHKNTCPVQLGFGDVVFVFANPVMKRVELLLRVHNEEAAKKGHLRVLEKIAAGERCDVSMGARVPYDLCSVCTDWAAIKTAENSFDPKRHRHPGIAVLEYHRKVKSIRGLAVTRADYCSCMTGSKNKVLPSGEKVFVYNDYPRFFDISFVYIGADRTARVMWSLGGELKGLPAPNSIQGALAALLDFGKVAHIEKELTGVVEAVLGDADTAAEVNFGGLIPEGGIAEVHQLLSSAAALGIVATPNEFQNLVSPLSQRLLGEFADTAAIDNTFAVSAANVQTPLLQALQHLCPERSAFAPFLTPRLKGSAPKLAAARAPGKRCRHLDKIAAQYNGYRLSILEKAAALTQRSEVMFLDPFAKTAGTEALATLLLGAAPVLHLVASHLRRKGNEGEQLGVMAQFVAENPTFASLALLGAGIRTAMIAEQGGMLAAMVRLLAAAPKI